MENKIVFSQRMLRQSSEFQKILKTGSRFHFESRVTFYVRKSQQDHLRFGLTVPKAKIRKAVDRNQLKRWSRELMRQIWKQSPGLKPDIVVIIREKLKYVELQNVFGKFHQGLLSASAT